MSRTYFEPLGFIPRETVVNAIQYVLHALVWAVWWIRECVRASDTLSYISVRGITSAIYKLHSSLYPRKYNNDTSSKVSLIIYNLHFLYFNLGLIIPYLLCIIHSPSKWKVELVTGLSQYHFGPSCDIITFSSTTASL